MKLKPVVLTVGITTIIVLVLLITIPRKDICSDTIRGYTEEANSSLEIIRTDLKQLRGTLGSESTLEVPQIPDLNAANFSALHGCEVQCRVLTQCLRFRIFKPPSDACPREYSDLKETQQRAEHLLERLSLIGSQVKKAQAQTSELTQSRDQVHELELASGATGTQLSLAKGNQRKLEHELATQLDQVGSNLSALRQKQGDLR